MKNINNLILGETWSKPMELTWLRTRSRTRIQVTTAVEKPVEDQVEDEVCIPIEQHLWELIQRRESNE
jgi:hypothetical protein